MKKRNRTKRIGNWIVPELVAKKLSLSRGMFYYWKKRGRFNFTITKDYGNVMYWEPDVDKFIKRGRIDDKNED